MLTSVLNQMLNYECPHCHERTISFWRSENFRKHIRQYADLPTYDATVVCTKCGGRSSLAFWSVATSAVVSLAVFLVVAWVFGWGSWLMWILVAAIGVVSVVLQPRLMSLNKA
jgi:predicted RNA-binding Zn-ribbon protein involved in translation (DUF1610 family)